MSRSIIVLSGGFDPLHEGHIAMFDAASASYDVVYVGLNSDEWLTRKKGKPFMTFKTRWSILKSLTQIDYIAAFDDSDDSAIDLLKRLLDWNRPGDSITFGNGGDKANSNYPEYDFCIKNNIKINDTLGGSHKINSSSALLKNWNIESMIRDWGQWKVLHSYPPETKIKELIVTPGASLSWQQHLQRSEKWFIRTGIATLYHSNDYDKNINKNILVKDDMITIPSERWHKLLNDYKENLSIIEIQYGSNCIESDIIRKPFPSFYL